MMMFPSLAFNFHVVKLLIKPKHHILVSQPLHKFPFKWSAGCTYKVQHGLHL